MEGSVFASARAREHLRAENEFVGRLEHLRGEFLAVPRWNFPPAREAERLRGLDAERDALVAEVCRFVNRARIKAERLAACVMRLNEAAEKARSIVSVRNAEEVP